MSATQTITSILLSYDEPLVVQAVDGLGRIHVGINYDDDGDRHKFAFVQVTAKDWQAFTTQRIDLRFVFTDRRRSVFRSAAIRGEVGETFSTLPCKDDPELFLPEAGLFLDVESLQPSLASQRARLATKIDGRWEMDDLREFASLTGDAYAFTYALVSPLADGNADLQDLFSRYPWRGGFSTINFISDLRGNMPAAADMSIAEIRYASPGFIDTRVDAKIAHALSTIIDDINEHARTKDDKMLEVYYRTFNDIKKRKWTGKATVDLRLTGSDEAVLRNHLTELCAKIGLEDRLGHILSLGHNDLLAAVKIVLAYYRRMFWIAKYLRTGRVQHLFSYDRAEFSDDIFQ